MRLIGVLVKYLSLLHRGWGFQFDFERMQQHEYKKITFDKNILTNDATLEWVTPGHPLFECVRDDVLARVQDDLRGGAVFYDLYRHQPGRFYPTQNALRRRLRGWLAMMRLNVLQLRR